MELHLPDRVQPHVDLCPECPLVWRVPRAEVDPAERRQIVLPTQLQRRQQPPAAQHQEQRLSAG